MTALVLMAGLLLAQAEEVETPEGDILFQVPLTDSERLRLLEEKVARLEARPAPAPAAVNANPFAMSVFGYADFGFFVPVGSGVGYLQDHGNQRLPQYAGRYGWVFYGDILSTAVNARGEVADLGDAPGVTRYDTVHSRGAPGFILNVVNLGARAVLFDQVLFTTSVNFTPRSGGEFALGDTFDLDLAQLEWMPTRDQRISIFAGKMDSVLGVEYRQRTAADRFNVTPSLLARYTTGTALGLKARGKFFKGDFLTIAAAVTNGSNTTEQFHFYDELDSNAGKTGSGRVSVKPFGLIDDNPLGDLEIGFSGSFGSQDRARDSLHPMWFFGFNLLYTKGPISLEAQYLRGVAAGDGAQGVYGLFLQQGLYATILWRIIPLLGVLVRGEFRDALVWLGDERLYVTRSFRVTVGARLTFNEHISLKAEYLFNGEYDGIPYVPNDVFTSSLVLTY